MSIILFAIVIIICAALAVAAVKQIPLDPPFPNILIALILLLCAYAIANKAGIV